VSLLWRNRIQVFLAPEQVNLVGFARGFKPVQRYEQSSSCVHQIHTAHPWKAPLQVLEHMLAQVEDNFRDGAELHITLSNYFVRYTTIAPQASLVNPDELMAYANFQLREIYAERVNDWALSVSAWSPGSGALCAAIAHDLQSELEALAQRHAIQRVQIEPYFAAAFDHWSKQLVGKQIWFVLVEAGRFCLASLIDSVWRSVRNQKVVANLQEELLSALAQESIMLGAGQSTEQVYVLAPRQTELFVDHHDTRWQFVHLSDENHSATIHFPWGYGINGRCNHA
jgi:hypothetical protein